MKLVNRTSYDTRVLRRIITTVHRVMAKNEGRLPAWRHLRITVETRRARQYEGRVSGWASYGGGRMMLRLPHPRRHHVGAHRVAWLVEHELYHSYGRKHGSFREEPEEWWAQHVGTDPLPLKARKAHPARDLVAERRAHAQRLLRQWERRAKLAQTKVRQYRKKVRYYDRAAARRSGANKSSPEEAMQ